MYADQGMKGFYRGVEVNVIRACVLNATKMGVYDISKGKVVEATGWARKDARTAFFSSFVAGFFMTCTVVSINITSHWPMLRKIVADPKTTRCAPCCTGSI